MWQIVARKVSSLLGHKVYPHETKRYCTAVTVTVPVAVPPLPSLIL